jgi:hypothetical protein
MRMSERYADLEQELIADYRVMELEGNHYELHGRRNLTGQIERVRWLGAQIAEAGPDDPDEAWTWAQQVLRDHSVPVCHHRPAQATLWALTANLTERRIAYCLGAPSRNRFEEHRWPV